MAKFQDDAMLDAALNEIKNNVVLVTVCSGQPTTFTAATTAKSGGTGFEVARHVLSTGDFTLANGDTSGRKVTFAQQTGLTVSTTGGANHLALCETSGSGTLWYVTTATSQNVTSGNALTINAWDIEIADST